MVSMTTREGKRLEGRACSRCHWATTEELRAILCEAETVGDEV